MSSILHSHAEAVELKEAPGGGDTSLPPVLLRDDYLVEGFKEVHLGKDPGPSNVLGKGADVWERISIKDSPLVESAIVPDWAE